MTREEALSEKLIGLHDAAVRTATRMVMGCPSIDPEDLVAEAYERAYKALDRFRGEAKVETWFYRIVERLCIDAARRAKRQGVILSMSDPVLVKGEESEITFDPEDPLAETDAEDLVRRRKERAWRKVISRLSPKLKPVLILYDIRGLSHEEIAEFLGIPLGTVKSRLFNARKQAHDLALEMGYPDFPEDEPEKVEPAERAIPEVNRADLLARATDGKPRKRVKFDWNQRVKHLAGYPDCPSVSDWLWDRWLNDKSNWEECLSLALKMYPKINMGMIQGHLSERVVKAAAANPTPKPSEDEQPKVSLVQPGSLGPNLHLPFWGEVSKRRHPRKKATAKPNPGSGNGNGDEEEREMALLLLPDLLAAIAADPQKLRDFCANKASKLKGELPQLAGNDYKLTEYLVTKPILTRELLEYYTS